MKKRFSIIFLALVILFASTTDVHASRYEFFRDVARAVSRKNLDNIETGGFEIKNYEVNSVVGKDHSINVTETISVNFLERRHGLVRYIPYIMAASRTDKNGKVKDYKYRTMISNIEVNNEAYRIEVHDDYFYIFIGDKDYRSKGYGTEAIRLILDYGFNYMNLKNIKLDLMDFNERALKCYKKCGFKEYGRRRKCVYVNGKYYDKISMDILDEEFTESYIKNKNIR